MKKTLLYALLAITLIGCSQSPTARISATVEGVADSSVVLKKLNLNRLTAVDTIKTDAAGKFDYKVKLEGNAPYFYYLYLGETPVASVVLLDGDKVNVNVKAHGGYAVEGSEESNMFQQVNDSFNKAFNAMEKVLDAMPENPSDVQMKEVNKQLSAIYVDYKKYAVKHVITNPYSISSAVVLFQKFNDDLKVFGETSDAVIFKRTLDSLSTVYPKSDYVLALRDEVDAREKQMSMYNRFSEAQQVSFPEISLPDVDGNIRNLSDFEGKVIILSFWSVAQAEYKMFNNDLASLYDKYHDQGLEIYQVGLDIDKPTWAAVVKGQKLPFVNVNDGLGIQSPSVAAYNITRVPAMLILDKSGSVAGRDIYDSSKLETVVKGLL